jgi:hypothetical protein
MKHLLLEKAYIYPLPKEEPIMAGCSFDVEKGYWVLNDMDIPLILNIRGLIPRSKKADVETGEDQKGE